MSYKKLHLIHLVNELPSDAVAITHVKGIPGSIRKGYMYYSPKRHEIYSKLVCPDDGFKYIVEDGRTTLFGNKEILTSYLYASCEKKFKNR